MNIQKSNFSMRIWWKLAGLAGVAGVFALVAAPVAARFYPRYALFQPSAYSSYPYRSFKSSIADTLSKEAKFANLVDELKEAGLLDTLKQSGPFTIFAPTDDAFNALPKDIFRRYSQPENRKKVLQYHVVSGHVTPDRVDSGAIATVEGNAVKIAIAPDGTVKLNNAHGKHPSIVTQNGVIIEVDRVLLPPDF
ncbi:fasciclin domain-containing protein [Chroococcidiopsis sp. FACHB-1243]|uniref:fasciclin domain-containing protein n=1 Tax=Chroococcidiopsis sp. [FACHB-1243] TaxID=2692781 RepID=UPI00177E160E|nr:fasciclin domain-containing protein [Chroococcidiopsis sp. [FACHB-1243]]MBD2306283.1 fasciclin domain-containing protein [Chroococcidiopsis sp. [FACHB-1243]]